MFQTVFEVVLPHTAFLGKDTSANAGLDPVARGLIKWWLQIATTKLRLWILHQKTHLCFAVSVRNTRYGENIDYLALAVTISESDSVT